MSLETKRFLGTQGEMGLKTLKKGSIRERKSESKAAFCSINNKYYLKYIKGSNINYKVFVVLRLFRIRRRTGCFESHCHSRIHSILLFPSWKKIYLVFFLLLPLPLHSFLSRQVTEWALWKGLRPCRTNTI